MHPLANMDNPWGTRQDQHHGHEEVIATRRVSMLRSKMDKFRGVEYARHEVYHGRRVRQMRCDKLVAR